VASDGGPARPSARGRSPVRLVIALSVAAVLAVFLLYSSIAGGGTPSVRPSSLAGHTGKVSLTGKVVKPVTGDAHGAGLRFRLRDVKGVATVPVVYTGSVPDLFRPGRDIVVEGRFRNGVFVALPDSMVTKCPSKYSPARKGGQG
jgi:cytochrome c-type biogenesis protein CcmE